MKRTGRLIDEFEVFSLFRRTDERVDDPVEGAEDHERHRKHCSRVFVNGVRKGDVIVGRCGGRLLDERCPGVDHL